MSLPSWFDSPCSPLAPVTAGAGSAAGRGLPPVPPEPLPGSDATRGGWRTGPTGLPLLDGAIATLECTIVQTVSVGDHDLFIGRVDALASAVDHPSPLLYFRRRYLRVEKARAVAPQGRP